MEALVSKDRKSLESHRNFAKIYHQTVFGRKKDMSNKKYKINIARMAVRLLILVCLIAIGIHIVPQIFKKPCEHVFAEDGFCTICGEECVHEYVDGVCSICKKPCEHEYGEDRICTICGMVKPDEILNLSVIAGGDVMAHLANIESAFNWDGSFEQGYAGYQTVYSDGSFDFTDNYTYVKPYIQDADLALVNVETTFSTGGPIYSGYWGSFSAPDALAAALSDAGFDVAFTCNNHSLDYGGIAGLQRTVQVLRDNGLTVVGSRKSTDENRSSVIEVNGIKVGLVAYTYETGTEYDWRQLNGAPMEDGAWNYLNGYRWSASTYLACDEDKQAIGEQIRWCKDNGAEIVIAYFHWDTFNEYVFEVTSLQSDLARFAAEQGADIVLGSHPHRVQRMEVLSVTDADGKERQVPVYYSLGNYISNQRYETMDWTPADDPYASEQEIMAYLEVEYNRTKDIVNFTKISAIPMYVDKFWGDNLEYRIYPLVGDYTSGTELGISGNAWRADQALSTLTGILGEQYIYR